MYTFKQLRAGVVLAFVLLVLAASAVIIPTSSIAYLAKSVHTDVAVGTSTYTVSFAGGMQTTDNVEVWVNGVENTAASVVWLTGSTLQLVGYSPAAGDDIEFRRVSPKTDNLVDLEAGKTIRASNLMKNFRHVLQVGQETYDMASSMLTIADDSVAAAIAAAEDAAESAALIDPENHLYVVHNLFSLGSVTADNYTTVYLDGHTTQNDGGQGVWKWDSTSTAAEDNGTIRAVTGVTVGRWIRQTGTVVTPEMFGPNTTPGTTDMTAEIQAAIDYAYSNSNKYEVRLSGSIYAVSTTLNTYSATNITGVSNYETSQGTRIKWIGGNNDSIVALYDYNVISNIFIYNGNASTGIIGVDCIGAAGANRRSSHLTMKNVSVKSCAVGMSMKYMWYNSIEQFSATYCTTGIYIDTAVNNTVFTACHTSNTTNGIVSVTGGYSLQIAFNSCSFESSSADAIDSTDPVEWYFNNCYFELNSTYCAKLTSPKGVTFKRCFVTNCLKGINVIGNHGLEVDSCTFNLSGTDKINGFTFSGDFADEAIWKKNRLVISNITTTSATVGYLTSAIERYPELVTEGLFDFNKSNITILETGLLDASTTQTECIIPYLSKRGIAHKRMSLALLEVYDPIVTTGFRVRFGYSGNYDQYINNLYSSDVSAGIHILPNVTPGLSPILPTALYTPGAGNIDRINNVTTGATGTYKMIFILTE